MTSSRLAHRLPAGPRDDAVHHGARRGTHRVPFHAEVELVGPHAAQGVALNVSRGGVRVALEGEVRIGDVCGVRVVLDDGREAAERARVVWKRRLPDGWLAGLAFV